MAKRWMACLLGLLLAGAMRNMAFAKGFYGSSSYTDTTPEYHMIPDEARQVYSKEYIEYPDYFEIYTGSVLYIPIGVYDEDTDEDTYATAKQIKDSKVEISYMALRGGQFVSKVSIVDGKKDKISGLPTGSYVKVEFVDNYSGVDYVQVELALVLSVNRVSYQQTRVELDCDLANREEWIDQRSVYGAQVPTRFRVTRSFAGDVTFDMGSGVTYTALVKPGLRYAVNFTKEEDYDIGVMYPDAYLEYYRFLGSNDTFASNGTLKIPVNKQKFNNKEAGAPRVFAYEIMDNRRLRALASDETIYDSQNNTLTIRTATLSNYVLSNVLLLPEVEEDLDQTFQSGYAVREEEPVSSAEAALAAAAQQAAQSQTQSQSSSSGQASSSQSSSSQASDSTHLRTEVSPYDPDPFSASISRRYVSGTPAADASSTAPAASAAPAVTPDSEILGNPTTGGGVSALLVGLPLFGVALCGALLGTKARKK